MSVLCVMALFSVLSSFYADVTGNLFHKCSKKPHKRTKLLFCYVELM